MLFSIRRSSWLSGLTALVLSLNVGCAAITNPVADGIPVRRLSPEFLSPSKQDEETIPLTCLGQQQPAAYRLAPGDVLGIWIEGILGSANQVPPLHVAAPVQLKDQRRLTPAVGIPIPVSDKGTIDLPMLDPLLVEGLTLQQVQEAIRKAYVVQKQVLKAGNERILVSLLQPRTVKVVVLRQESTSFSPGVDVTVITTGKRGNGQLIELPAYENDVLHALTQTGGLPGLDAYNTVYVFRRGFGPGQDVRFLIDQCQRQGTCGLIGCRDGAIRIPLRRKCGMPVPLRPEDVILQDGDVVFLEARDAELYYTAGLLPSGEHILPRDRDVDVLEAIARVRGPLVNGLFGTNNLAGNLVQPGIGNPSASLLTVIRKTPSGHQVPIKVDIARALVDRRERLIVQSGDLLILQEKPNEALARYLSTSFFNFSIAWQAIQNSSMLGVLDINAPQNVPGRIGVGTTVQQLGN